MTRCAECSFAKFQSKHQKPDSKAFTVRVGESKPQCTCSMKNPLRSLRKPCKEAFSSLQDQAEPKEAKVAKGAKANGQGPQLSGEGYVFAVCMYHTICKICVCIYIYTHR